MLNFTATKEEHEQMVAIARRATELLEEPHTIIMDIVMDINVAHSNGCKLDLAALLSADDSDLLHDVCGINQYIDRETGELVDCFVPRYAARNTPNA